MKTKYFYLIIIFLALVASNFIFGFKLLKTNKELSYVLKNSDVLTRLSSKVVFNAYKYNFGNLKNEQVYRTNFSFVNDSTRAVALKAVQPSCECTTPDWTKDKIQPGYTGNIQVAYHATQLGPFTKEIMVYLENNPRPVKLEIVGNVVE